MASTNVCKHQKNNNSPTRIAVKLRHFQIVLSLITEFVRLRFVAPLVTLTDTGDGRRYHGRR